MEGSVPASPLAGFACRERRESLVLGERADGSIAHVSEVASGKACSCVCPGCGAPLVARKGPRNDHHFAHEGTPDGLPCRTGPETALHKFAKEILGRRLRLALPPLTLNEGGDRWIGYKGGGYRFDGAVLEQRLGSIVPDVVVRRGGRDLLVEMAVTHPCGPEKIETIRSMDVAAIEIDLAGLPRDVSRVDLETAILEAAPRRWIHNPLLAAGKAELEERKASRQAALRRRAQALATDYAVALQEIREARPSTKVFGEMTRDGFGTSIGIPVRGAGCFSVPPGDWQATLLSGLWDRYQDRRTTTFRAEGALGRLRQEGWVRARFARMSDEEIAAAKMENAAFNSPLAAVVEWASALALNQVLMSWHPGWKVHPSHLRKADEARNRRLLPARRAGEIKGVVEQILASLPEAERDGFDLRAWAAAPLPGRDHSAAAATRFDDAKYKAFKSALDRLASDVRHGTRLDRDRLGLPLDVMAARREAAAREQAEARRRERIEREEAASLARGQELLSAARSELGFDAADWAATPRSDLGGVSPLDAARSSVDGAHAARAAIRAEIHRARLQATSEAEAEEARRLLRAEARKLVPPAQFELYLTGRQSALDGKSPLEFCVTPGLVARCIAATLPARKGRR
ncbi:hypothetical protein BHAOGJBA_6024 [Methylobacterium hispanicum]|uniref:Competence protein CoiA-like protein n=1 Tax=Methylobacterium hispanicum TaxID=270350 RepID=A0AAV4ZX45_9HYPH|nr:hypothetical protein [Methylobacterium hispanicum]GJD92470.1 hypothetical protein BHAOGJBA_6024 [Methylobacterium hispanicum]